MALPVSTTVTVNGTRYESTKAAVTAGRPFIVGDVVTTWTRPSPVDNTDPSTLSFTIRRRRGWWAPTIRVGDDVRVDATLPGVPTVAVFIGKVDAVKTQRAAAGTVDVQVSATCLKAQEGRKRFGSAPWPVRWTSDNLAVIAKLWPGFTYQPIKDQDALFKDMKLEPNCQAVDIDSRSPVEVAEQLVAPYGYEVRTTSKGLQLADASWSIIGADTALMFHGARASTNQNPRILNLVSLVGPLGIRIPASVIEDVDMEESFDTYLSSVSVDFEVRMPSLKYRRDTSKTWGDPRLGGISLRIATLDSDTGGYSKPLEPPGMTQDDFDKVVGNPPPDVASAAPKLVGGTVIEPRLDPVRIPIDAIPAEQMRDLINLDTRWDRLVTISGARPDVPIVHRVTGGTLTLSGDADRCALTLDLVPASFARSTLYRYSDLNTLFTTEPTITWDHLYSYAPTRKERAFYSIYGDTWEAWSVAEMGTDWVAMGIS